MDGAGKFVSGDVNAGMFITFINIVGGIFIGVLQKDMSWMEAATTFSLLTIGDGLVSTIPSLITSTSAGLIVSRAASEARMGEEFIGQLTNHPKALRLVSCVLLLFAIVPGMPTLAFMTLSLVLFMVALFADRIKAEHKSPETGKKKKGSAPDSPEEVQALLPLDIMELEVGYGLIPLVDEDQNGNLLARIRSIRRQFALDMGVIVPSLHLRDNLQLKPGEYVVQIKGNRVASAEIMIDHFLAMDPGDARHAIKGIETLEPAFNLPALWIPDAKKDEAVMAGYTVVDPSTVIATHLTEVFKQNLHEFLGRQEVQALLDNLSQRAPKVVEELVPGVLSLGVLQKVLQNLVRENVSIRDLLSIVECLADYGHSSKDADQLTEFVRQRLSRTIIKPYLGTGNLLPIISLSPTIENTFQESIKRTDNGSYLAMEPGLAHKIIQAINKAAEKGIVAEGQPVLLTSPLIRQHLSQLLARFLPTMPVISQAEIPADIRLESVAMVEI
jgi:flagellar biosynthesis protein FlhA